MALGIKEKKKTNLFVVALFHIVLIAAVTWPHAASAFRPPWSSRSSNDLPLYSSRDNIKRSSFRSGLPLEIASSLVQLTSASGIKEDPESEVAGSGTEGGASQVDRGKARESISETEEEGEEEGTSSPSQSEGEERHYSAQSKKDSHFESAKKSSAADAEGDNWAQSNTKEAHREHPVNPTDKAPTSDSAAKESTTSVAAPYANSPTGALPPSASEAAASGKLGESKEKNEREDMSSMHSHEHAAESSVEKTEYKGETGASATAEPNVPSTDRFVLQLNFRPSMILNRVDADRAERHVVTEKGGTTWYQVVGSKDLAVLKLKPIQGEELLHRESVSEYHN